MLILCRLPVIGLNLLLLTHIAHTFVLLTANMEDVKKLARKFVSDSLAEKIADFIAKATQNMASNVSGDNEMNEGDSHQVSEENNRYNVESGQDNGKSKEEMLSENQEESPSGSNEQNRPDIDPPASEDKTEKQDFQGLESPNRYVKLAPKTNTIKQYAYPLQTDKKTVPKASEEDEKFKDHQSKYLEENFVNPSTPQAEQFVEKPKKHKVKGRPYRLLSHLNSIEDNEVTDLPENATLDDFSENELFNQKRSMNSALTSKKAPIEFDQYDIKKYHKPDPIATSGIVQLHLPETTENNNKWWEKELSSPKNIEPIENGRKTWF